MEKIEFKSPVSEKIWQVLLGLFCISVFVSKSGLSIFGLLLILISVFILPWKNIVKNRKEVLFFVGLYPLAIFCNLFSLGGVPAAIKVAGSWPWVLLALPALVVFFRPKDQKIALLTGGLGLAVACGLSLYYFFFQYGGEFVTGVRVASFWDISRWGLFLASSLIGILALSQYFNKTETRKSFIILQLAFLIAAACLVLSNTRAPWLATAAGCLVFILLYPRLLKIYGSYLILLCLCFALFPPLRDRVVSMFEIQKSADGKMTSANGSNAGRLHMWQVALEFYKEQPWFGTGFESTVEPLQNYMDRRGPDYKAKYMTEDFSFSDQHSSYLSTLIQMGVIFSAIFWGILGYLFVSFAATWWRSRNLWAAAMICLMICHGVLFVFYSSTNSYDAVALFPFISLLVKNPTERAL